MPGTVVIFGGGGGIGRAFAQLMDESAEKFVLIGRTERRLAETAALLKKPCQCVTGDITNPDTVEQIAGSLGPVDHVLVAVGDLFLSSLADLDLKLARAAFETKFWAGVYVGKFVGPLIRPSGTLTFLGGGGTPPDWHARQEWLITAAGNAGLATLAQVLALELSPVRVNIVSPGLILEGTDRMAEPSVALLPAGVGGLADDVASVIQMIVKNPFITGASIPVDGGARLA